MIHKIIKYFQEKLTHQLTRARGLTDMKDAKGHRKFEHAGTRAHQHRWREGKPKNLGTLVRGHEVTLSSIVRGHAINVDTRARRHTNIDGTRAY